MPHYRVKLHGGGSFVVKADSPEQARERAAERFNRRGAQKYGVTRRESTKSITRGAERIDPSITHTHGGGTHHNHSGYAATTMREGKPHTHKAKTGTWAD